jgi:hypothetical protein
MTMDIVTVKRKIGTMILCSRGIKSAIDDGMINSVL